MADIDIDIDLRGPIFDGRAEAALQGLQHAIINDLADQAYSEWMGNLNGSIRNPTPYYETQITITRHDDGAVVHDRGIVYGPWLEGTSSRNRTTRFKGYAARRRAVAALKVKAGPIAAHAAAKYIREMG